jgi:hypothetical protein
MAFSKTLSRLSLFCYTTWNAPFAFLLCICLPSNPTLANRAATASSQCLWPTSRYIKVNGPSVTRRSVYLLQRQWPWFPSVHHLTLCVPPSLYGLALHSSAVFNVSERSTHLAHLKFDIHRRLQWTDTVGASYTWSSLTNRDVYLWEMYVCTSYNKSQRDALFIKFILVQNSTCFGEIYCQSWGVSTLHTLYRSGPRQQTASTTSMTSTYCCVYSIETPDDWQ